MLGGERQDRDGTLGALATLNPSGERIVFFDLAKAPKPGETEPTWAAAMTGAQEGEGESG